MRYGQNLDKRVKCKADKLSIVSNFTNKGFVVMSALAEEKRDYVHKKMLDAWVMSLFRESRQNPFQCKKRIW